MARNAEEKSSEKTVAEDKSDSETSDTVEAFTASISYAPHQMDKWLIDSGASSHMTWKRNILTNYKEFVQIQKVSLGDCLTVDALSVGDVQVNMQIEISKSRKCVIYHVLYVPEVACNLSSVRVAVTRGKFEKFGQSHCWIENANGKLCGMGSMINKLYRLNCELL